MDSWLETLFVVRIVGGITILGLILVLYLFRRKGIFVLQKVLRVPPSLVVIPGPGVEKIIPRSTIDKLAHRTYRVATRKINADDQAAIDELPRAPGTQPCFTWSSGDIDVTTKYFVVDGIPTVEVLLGHPHPVRENA